MTAFQMNDGIGDALRAAAVLWRTRANKPSVEILVERSPGGGAEDVFRMLSFVKGVTSVPRGRYLDTRPGYRQALADPEACVGLWHDSDVWLRFKQQFGQLRLPDDAFDGKYPGEWLGSACWETGPGFAGGSYTVVQPATSDFKERRLSFALPAGHTYVLLGSEADRSVEVRMDAGADVDDAFFLDLRGQTTVRQALSWIYCANAVIGVESWVAIAGALFGIPVVQEIDERAYAQLAPTWQVLFPTMGFRVIDR